jgi:uncharacterized protein YcgI (DUF1989 family)
MATCIEDTVGEDADHLRHHLVGTYCSEETIRIQFGAEAIKSCRASLLESVVPFGLTENDLHDSVTVHQKTRLDPITGRRSITRGDSQPGDYIEFYAELPLLVAVSVCPFGDGSANPTLRGHDVVRPLTIEIYDTGTEPPAFPAWFDWRASWTGAWKWPDST